jgi:hypothetical protein
MNIDDGKSLENFNDIPEFYKEIIKIKIWIFQLILMSW